MTIENEDRLLVNRGSKSYQIKYEKIKQDIEGDINAFPEAPEDTKQYGRENGEWTEIVHTPEYTDADVDAHLRLDVGSDSTGKVLGYDGSNYQWVDSSGGGSDETTYKHPGGISRTVQDRLQDATSVKDFGAEGDGTKDDTDKINACIDWVGQNGGGTVYFPPGTYMVELKGTKGDGTNSWHQCALKVNYDNVHLVGAGQGATIIKSIATSFQVLDDGDPDPSTYKDNSYGLIEVIKYPFGNAIDADNPGTPVQGGSVRNMTLDNNISSTDVMSGAVLHLKHTSNYTVENVGVKNSPFYGIGMQNGGFVNVIISNVTLTNITRDGIDLKDNGNISWGTRIDNVTCINVGRGSDPGAPYACVDLQGDALQVSNLVCKNLGSGCGAGLRLKQAGKEGKRGDPGWYSSISNVYIEYTGSSKIKHGIQLKARGVSVFGAKVRGQFQYGIAVEQAGCSLIGCYVQGDRTDDTGTIGCYIEPASGSNTDEYPDRGGEYTMIQGCQFRNTWKSIQVLRPNCTIIGNAFFNAGIGIDVNNTDVTNAVIFGNVFDDSVKNDIEQAQNKTIFMLNNVGNWGPGITVQNAYDGGQALGQIMALTAANGEKQIKISQNGVGFYGQNPVQKQEVTGDTGSNVNAVVRDLLIELAQTGLIKNSTTNTPTPTPTPPPTPTPSPSENFDPNGMVKTSPSRIGFYGESPVQRQTVSGNLQTNLDDVVRDLIRELAQTGLIIDNTSG